MSDTRTPDEIERDIERERARLGSTVDELQERLSPERIMREVGRGISEHGGEFGMAITQSVKRNPVALALTGIGLAWLMSGKSWDETASTVRHSMPGTGRDRVGSPTRNPYNSPDRAYGDVASTQGEYTRPPFGDPYGHAAGGLGAGRHVDDDWLYADDDWDDEYEYGDDDSGPGFGEQVSDAASTAGERVASGAASARNAASSGAASVRDGIARANRTTAERARRIRSRLASGTESMTEQARERVIAARWAAVKARRSAARRARAGADAVSDFYEENPLVMGGLALVAGAILGGSLPRTRQEDDAFGAYSDDAYARAERIFHTERRKAEKVVGRAAETARDVLREERENVDDQAPGHKSAAEHVADKVREGTSRVADATAAEAEKQKLGKPAE